MSTPFPKRNDEYTVPGMGHVARLEHHTTVASYRLQTGEFKITFYLFINMLSELRIGLIVYCTIHDRPYSVFSTFM